MTVGMVTGMEMLYTIIKECLIAENTTNGLLEDVETIVNSYYTDAHLEEPVVWVTQHPARANRQADISQTMELVVPFEFDCGVYDVDLDESDLASQNLANRVIMSILNNWQQIQSEELPGQRLIKNITLQTYSPVGYVNVTGKSDKVAVTGVILNVNVILNWRMCYQRISTHTLTLNVVNQQNQPIRNAEVTLQGAGQNTTNQYGVVTFTVPYDTYNVSVDAQGYRSYTGTVDFTQYDDTFTITLTTSGPTPPPTPTPTVTFNVVDERNQPIRNATVNIRGVGATITNQYGVAKFTISYDTYEVSVTAEGYTDYEGTVEFTENNKTFTITLNPVPTPTPTVTLNVVNEQNQPISNAQVGILGGGVTLTNQDGVATFTVQYGTLTVTAVAFGYRSYNGTVDFTENNDTFTITLTPTGPTPPSEP